MLSSLHIENIAVLKSVDVDLSSGFSVFTGETGAGKSMIIDSISFLLGNRADREMIRQGEERALVSAVFEDLNAAARAALSGAGVDPDEDGRLMIQRTLSADGKSAVKINGRSATLAVLRLLAPALINIHGQSETQTLTDPACHAAILDSFAHADDARAAYAVSYRDLCDVRRRIREIACDESERLRTVEMLKYQLADIDALSLKPGEYEKLEEKRGRLKNAERISRGTSFAYRALKGSEKGSVSYILSRSIQSLRQLDDVIPETGQLAARLEECMWQVDDIAERVNDLSGEDEGDPTELLNRVEDRLDKISRLFRKYGASVEEILAFRQKTAARLAELESADERMKELNKEESACVARAGEAAARLHEIRAAWAGKLTDEIGRSLAFLDMPRVRFDVCVERRVENGEPVFAADGYDRVEFLIATNPGEVPGPLGRIASGGELSRIMLALKSVIADRDGIATVIYDEIDTGVSGKTARKIGFKLKEGAAHTQVLSVTHSAQIASLADAHYLIEKKEENGRAATTVRLLDRDGRVDEIARILGGLSVTDAQRRAALDMLDGQ